MLVQMDVRSILSASFRQIWKFLALFVPIVVIGLLYVMTATKHYESNATLLVKFGQDARPEMSQDSRGASLTAEEKRGLVQSNLNILLSRDIAEQLIEKVGIERLYPEIANKTMPEAAKKDAALRAYFADIKTSTESNAGIIKVSIFHTEPQIAHEALNILIELFVAKQADIFGNPQIAVLRDQAKQSDVELQESARALFDFKQKTGIASIDEELTLLLQQRGDLVGYVSRRTTEPGRKIIAQRPPTDDKLDSADQTSASSRKVVNALPARISMSGDTSRFPVVEDVQRRIDELRARESELLLTYKPDSDMVQNVRKNIATETAALKRSLSALNDQIEDLDQQISERQEYRSQYDDLSRDVELKQESAKTAQARLQVAQVNDDLNQRKITRISIIEQPTVPVKPSKPKKTITMILCLLIAGAFGSAFCLGAEILDSTFSRAEQLSNAFKHPLLAAFRHTTFHSRKFAAMPEFWNKTVSPRTGLKPIPVKSHVIESHKGFSAKELSTLYQSLENALPGKASRVVNVTSCHTGEGVTTICYELGRMASSKLAQNVILICGADYIPASGDLIPRPSASLTDVIQGRSTIKDAVMGSALESGGSLSFARFSAGSQTGYDFVLGNAEKLEHVLEQLKESFSLILIATPGLMQNPSAKAFARASDGVAVVIEAEKTRAPVVQETLNTLSDSGANVLGMIFNKQVLYIPGWIYNRL